MSTAELKLSLHNLIDDIDNETLLKAIYVLITQKAETKANLDKWADFPESLKREIEEGLEQAKNGEVVEHQEVMKKYAKWL